MSGPVEPAPRVALLRGLNLGGRRTIAMAGLREVAAGLGWRGLVTHLQSGNLIFTAAGSDQEVAAILRQAVNSEYGISSDVLIRDGERLSSLLTEYPFDRSDPARSVICCYDIEIGELALRRLQDLALGREEVAVASTGKDVFACFPGGQAGSRLAAGLLAVTRPATGTARNLRTIARLVELLG